MKHYVVLKYIIRGLDWTDNKTNKLFKLQCNIYHVETRDETNRDVKVSNVLV